MSNYEIQEAILQPLQKTIATIPGDKSISHRAVIIGSLSNGTHTFHGFLCSEDCLNTVSIFKSLGISCHVDKKTSTLTITGKGPFGLETPQSSLDVGNSGTGIRLITGLLSAQPFSCSISGDHSIEQRPMKRIIDPLSQMGATITGRSIEGKTDIYPPLTITGTSGLTSLGTYTLSVASAQVKSALIFASLYADTPSIIKDLEPTRNHTELMFSNCSHNVSILEDQSVQVTPFTPTDTIQLPTTPIPIPSDFSSAAFFIVLGLIRPHTTLTIKNVGLNPTRSTLIDLLLSMGGSIEISEKTEDIEPIGTLTVSSSKLKNITINRNQPLPFFIDEIPILAIAALFGSGSFILDDAEELRVKESDRIKTTVDMIKAFGGTIQETENGFTLEGMRGKKFPDHIHVKSYGDHRIAMSAIIGAQAAGISATIEGVDCINTSFPNFFEIIESLK